MKFYLYRCGSLYLLKRRGSLVVALRRFSGFTLIELVAVMVIVGILSAVAVPRFNGLTAFYERLFYDEAVAAVRYARQRAVDMQCPYGVLFGTKSTTGDFTITSPGGFLVVRNAECLINDTSKFSAAVPRPDSIESDESLFEPIENPYEHANPRLLSVENKLIAFDTLGRPFAGSTPLDSPVLVCVAKRLISVTNGTGRVVRSRDSRDSC